MAKTKTFENYPSWMVLSYNLATFATYAAGAYILFQLGILFGALYLLFLFYLELSVYREGCVNCYYFGKVCIAGRGKIAPLFFKKGNPKKFCEKEMSFKDLVPQLLSVIIAEVVGIYLLLQSFSWLIVGVMAVPIIVWVFGNPIIYGKLACPHCKQGEICCPAKDYFSKM